MSEIIILKRPVECPECGYRWNTESLNYYVSCPRCRYTVKIREKKKEKEKVTTVSVRKHKVAMARGVLADSTDPIATDSLSSEKALVKPPKHG